MLGAKLKSAVERGSGRTAQFVEQRLGVLQVGSVEAFAEPVVDLRQHGAPLITTTLFGEQSREDGRRPQLKRFCALTACDFD